MSKCANPNCKHDYCTRMVLYGDIVLCWICNSKIPYKLRLEATRTGKNQGIAGTNPSADVSSNKELDMHVFEIKHINDQVPNDIDTLLSLVDRYKGGLEKILSEEGRRMWKDKELAKIYREIAMTCLGRRSISDA